MVATARKDRQTDRYTHTHTHTCRPVDGTSMNEECVAVDAVGSMSRSSNHGLTAKSAL